MSEERKKAVLYLKTAKGQIDAILRMLEEGRYCMDISDQISAASALVKKANVEILQGHLNSCLKTAIINEENIDKKMEEIHNALLKMTK